VFHSIEKRVAEAFRAHIQVRYGIDLPVAVEQPRQSEFGEMAVPAAFQLAKQLKQAPKKIAAELAAEVGPIPGVAAMEVAGNGYLNIRLDRGAYGEALLRGGAEEAAPSPEKIIGIVARTPPATNMAINGLMGKARPYPLFVEGGDVHQHRCQRPIGLLGPAPFGGSDRNPGEEGDPGMAKQPEREAFERLE